jgi:hypothetical protein
VYSHRVNRPRNHQQTQHVLRTDRAATHQCSHREILRNNQPLSRLPPLAASHQFNHLAIQLYSHSQNQLANQVYRLLSNILFNRFLYIHQNFNIEHTDLIPDYSTLDNIAELKTHTAAFTAAQYSYHATHRATFVSAYSISYISALNWTHVTTFRRPVQTSFYAAFASTSRPAVIKAFLPAFNISISTFISAFFKALSNSFKLPVSATLKAA